MRGGGSRPLPPLGGRMGALRGLGEARGAPPPLRGAQRDIGRDRCVVVMVVMVVRVGVGMVKVGMGVVVVGGVRGWLGGGAGGSIDRGVPEDEEGERERSGFNGNGGDDSGFERVSTEWRNSWHACVPMGGGWGGAWRWTGDARIFVPSSRHDAIQPPDRPTDGPTGLPTD